MKDDTELGDTFQPDLVVADANVGDFAGPVLPGGVGNPDKLRLEPQAVALVKAFAEQGKPIAAICHGPWTLVEADVLKGKTLTSWPSLQTDIRNARGAWQDTEVLSCPAKGFDLVTSRIRTISLRSTKPWSAPSPGRADGSFRLRTGPKWVCPGR